MGRSPNMFAAPAKQKSPADKLLISANEAGERMSVSGKHLLNLANEGKFPHVKVGERTLFNPVTIQKWIKDREAASVSQ